MTKEINHQICTRCVMDTTDPFIVFDKNGICNHCTNAKIKLQKINFGSEDERKKALDAIVKKIKESGKRAWA
jgi:hypothetical protein